MESQLNTVLNRVLSLPQGRRRRLVAIAGAPASGKSTLAASLVERLNQTGQSAVLVPMDGFHLDDPILRAKGLLARKGAPETFDAQGMLALVKRLAGGEAVYAPRFDRSQEQSIAGAIEVPAELDWVVIEGNYLLLKDDPWYQLEQYFDLTVFLQVSEAQLEARLMHRWLAYGYDQSQARAKAEGNDLLNARTIAAHSLPAMCQLVNE